MKKINKVAVVGCLLSVLIGCGSGKKATLAPLEPMTEQLPVTQLWSRHIGSGAPLHYTKLVPAVADKRLYVVDHRGDVFATDITTGKTIWSEKLATEISGGVAYGEETLFIPTSHGKLYALHANDGTERWQVNLPDQANTAPTYYDHQVIVKTIDDHVVALDAADGKRRWNYDEGPTQLQIMGSSRAIVAGRTVYAGFSDGKMNALSINSGELLWQTMIAIPHGFSDIGRMIGISADPIVANNVIYAATYNGTITALNASNGDILWQHPLSDYAGLALASDAVFAVDADGVVWAYSRYSGTVLWKQTTLQGRHLSGPAVMGKNVIIADNEGNLHWLSRQDGHFVARTKVTNNPISQAPLVVDNLLIVKANNGNIAVYKAL